MLRPLCPWVPLAQAGTLRLCCPRLSGTLGSWPLPSKTQPPSSPWGWVPAASLALAVAVVSRICPTAGPLLPAVGWSLQKAPPAHSFSAVCAKSLQSCPRNRDCSPPGSSVHGILQARILEWVAPPPGDLPHPGIKPASLMSSALACGFFTTSAPGKPSQLQ